MHTRPRGRPDRRQVRTEPVSAGSGSGALPFDPACGGETRATACAPPSTWMSSPLIASDQSESKKQIARATDVGSSQSQPSGAALAQVPESPSKPGMPPAAGEAIGPAETRLARI